MKGKVKRKHLCRGWNFSTFAAHLVVPVQTVDATLHLVD
jgi:hypothetical protein